MIREYFSYVNHGYSKKSGKEFNKISKEYDKGRGGENVKFWAKETKRLTGINEQSLVLDLGCGTGLYTVGLKEQTQAFVCGVDPVPGMLEVAAEKNKETPWLNAIGNHLPVRDGIFHCIFSSQVWHHIADKQGTVDECGRVLKKGGHVIIRTISHEQLNKKVVFKYFPEIKKNQLRVYPSNQDFKNYFGEARFSDTVFLAYRLERYQSVEEFVEIAEGRLWSMFRPITELGLKRGIEHLWRYHCESGGAPIKNDELITLVVSRK